MGGAAPPHYFAPPGVGRATEGNRGGTGGCRPHPPKPTKNYRPRWAPRGDQKKPGGKTRKGGRIRGPGKNPSFLGGVEGRAGPPTF